MFGIERLRAKDLSPVRAPKTYITQTSTFLPYRAEESTWYTLLPGLFTYLFLVLRTSLLLACQGRPSHDCQPGC